MDVKLDDLKVIHNEQAHRFEFHADGLLGLLTYRRFPDRIVFDHTEVPPPLEGKGLAAKLARFALDFARQEHLRVIPLCPYISSFLRKHTEYQDLISSEDLQKLLAH